MSTKRKLFRFLSLTALLFSGLGCSLIGRTASIATDRPAPVVTESPLPTEDTQAVETQVSAAIATAVNGGKVVLEFTEAQLTAIANQELQGQQDIQDLQIRLNSGTMEISGQVSQSGVQMPLSVTLKINVDAQGKPHAQILSGKVGPFGLPQNMLDQITAQFDQILQQQLDASANNLFVDGIGIDNGKITIVAHVQNN